MKTKLLALLTVSALAASANLVSAQTIISVNLVPDNGGPEDNEMTPSMSAGVVAAKNWNNTPIFGDTAQTQVVTIANDNNGDGTTANFSFVADGGGANAVVFAGPYSGDRQMMNGNVSLSSISWSSLPSFLTAGGYDAYFYFDDNNDGLGQGVSATLGTTTFFGDNSGNYTTATSPSYVRATGTTVDNANNSNYFLFEGLTADSGMVTSRIAPDARRSPDSSSSPFPSPPLSRCCWAAWGS